MDRPERIPTARSTILAAILGVVIGLSLVPRTAASQAAWTHGPPTRVAFYQDSLVQVALTSPDRQTRLVAIIGVASPGRARVETSDPHDAPPTVTYPGTVARLRRIYRETDASGREEVAGLLSTQAERSEAIAFLVELAQTTDAGLEYPIPITAIEQLSRLRPEGVAELRRLHEGGLVSNPTVRDHLDRLSRTGYRRPPRG